LIPAVDGVLLVCRAPGAHVSSAKQAIDIAEAIGAPLLGVALVTTTNRGPSRRLRRRPTNRKVPSAGNGSAPRVPRLGGRSETVSPPTQSNGNGTAAPAGSTPGPEPDEPAIRLDENDAVDADSLVVDASPSHDHVAEHELPA